MKLLSIILLFLFSIAINAQNIIIDDTKTARELVQDVLFNNSGCAAISNFNVSGNNSYAYFDGNASIFPFSEGVVLSTGFANHCIGPNNTLSDDDLGTPLDNDLDALFSNTLDATILEFDFIPVTNFMSFNYIFASEEYQEGDNSTCIYSDVFAFLIKKTTDSNYTNIALIPNTNIPVQVTTVHPEIPNSCSAENENYFGQWNDNTAPINFNGQTAVLKASSIVEPGATYHIKLVIADHSNYRYDSAVFLKAGSFNIGTDLGIDILRDTGNALCGNDSILLDSGIPVALSYTWLKDDIPYDNIFVPLPGGNGQTYNVTSEGKYKVTANLGGGCISEGIIVVEYSPFPIVVDTDLVSCNDDGNDYSEFNLNDAILDITNGDNSLMVSNFYLDANDSSTLISNFTAYTNLIQNQELFAEVKNRAGCMSFAKITLKVFQNPKILDDTEMFYCLNTYPETIEINSGITDDATNYTFRWFFDDGTSPVQLTQTTSEININASGIYTAEITNTDGCIVTRSTTIIPSSTATITNVLIADTFTPWRVSATILVTGEGNYEFAMDDFNYQDSNVFDTLLYGYHIITVRDKNGCIPNTQKEISILKYAKFFTPNGDGHYDTWNLDNINSLLLHFNTISPVTIYNRFGKIIATIDTKGSGWDGNYNGNPLPSSDYWFNVDLLDADGKTIKKRGNFTLKR